MIKSFGELKWWYKLHRDEIMIGLLSCLGAALIAMFVMCHTGVGA